MRKGFTLLELLIVITILAVLAGAMMPLFSTSRSAAEQAKVKADLDAIKSAAIMLHYDTSRWPTDGSAGICFITNDSGCINTTAGGSWKGPYMASWERDPFDNPYRIYNSTTNASQFAVSIGANDTFNTLGGDDIYILITSDRNAT